MAIDHLQIELDSTPDSFEACLFIDLQKEFETIPHVPFLDKLNHLGSRGPINNLLKIYLENRTQFVDIGNAISSKLINTNPFSTPQGSNLGPLYIKDMDKLPLKGKLILFADDTTLVYATISVSELKLKIQHDIDILYH